LELPQFPLAGRSPAVEPCPTELEALATVARFVTQPLSLVSLVAPCVHAVEVAVMTLGLHRRRTIGVGPCRGRIGPNACLDERGLVFAGAILSGTGLSGADDACDFCSHVAAIAVVALV
jgi:hypothetical protein